MESNPKFDEYGRVIPDKNLRKKFFRLSSASVFTNENTGAIMAIYDTEADDVYLATYLNLSLLRDENGSYRDKYKIMININEDAYWIREQDCVFIPDELYPHMYEAFPNLEYVNMKHIIRQ